MKICILGAGSLGCAIGGMLAADGAEVTLINRNADQVAAINARGLVLTTAQGEKVVRARAAQSCAGLSTVDLLIVLVKSFDTRTAIEGAMDVVGTDTTVLSLQNGLGHEDVLAEFVAPKNIVAGKTYAGGMITKPGHVIARTAGKDTIIGELDGTISDRVKEIAAVFSRANVPTTVTDNIVGTIWDKLLVNVATGALSAITRLPYGALYQAAAVETCAVAAVEEAMAVARSADVKISYADARRPWLAAAEGLPPEFKASMLQSLEKGSRTEIDYINGSVVRVGKRHGVPTPVNETLVACVKGIEKALGLEPPSLGGRAS